MSLSSVLLIGWICHRTGLDQLVFMLLTPIWLELLAIYLYHEMIGQSFGGLRVVLCQPDKAS